MLSGCYQNAIRILSGCYQDAIRMLSGCYQDTIRMLSDTIRMLSGCYQDAIRYYQDAIRMLSECYQILSGCYECDASSQCVQQQSLWMFQRPVSVSHSQCRAHPPQRDAVTRFVIFYACSLLTQGPRNMNICQLCWHLELNMQPIQKTAFKFRIIHALAREADEVPSAHGWTPRLWRAGCVFRRTDILRLLLKQRLTWFFCCVRWKNQRWRTNNLRMLRMIQTDFLLIADQRSLFYIFQVTSHTHYSATSPVSRHRYWSIESQSTIVWLFSCYTEKNVKQCILNKSVSPT